MAIRKNATLASVAEATTAKAIQAYREWDRVRRQPGQDWDAAREYVSGAAYRRWDDLREVAAHLRRLSNLPAHDCTTFPQDTPRVEHGIQAV